MCCTTSVYVSFLELGVEVRDADQIWRRYVHRSTFWSDLLAVLPFDALVLLVWHAYGGSLSALWSALVSGSALSRHGGQMMRRSIANEAVTNIFIIINVSPHNARFRVENQATFFSKFARNKS